MTAPSQFEGLDKPFDYIIVGGGTAGLVVASRLTEDSDVRVLVVEAGADKTSDPLVLTPGLVAGLYGKDEYDWNFTSVPQVIHPSWRLYSSFCADLRLLHSRQPSTTDASTKPAARCSAAPPRSTS
jgi:choline dehydrogenase-like flavoprotein